MSQPPATFTVGSLYIVGFAQAGAPHAGLLIPTGTETGCLVHIRIDRNTSPLWAYQSTRTQRISGDMFMTTLLKIRDVSDGAIRIEQLQDIAASVQVPLNDQFGECLPWVLRAVAKLHDAELVNLIDGELLRNEFEEFAAGNKAFATRFKFPNVKASDYCL